jgi:hypothetical protein
MTSSCGDDPVRLQSFPTATRAKPARAMPQVAKATLDSCNDPDRMLRLNRSHAQTQKGFRRLANTITREAIGIPLTRNQRSEQRAQRRKLDPKEIDKNSYRTHRVFIRGQDGRKNRKAS